MDRKRVYHFNSFLLNFTGLTLATMLWSVPSSADPMKAAMAGKVVSVAGRVLIRQDSATGGKAAVALKPGDMVSEGDVLNTSSDGSAKLLLADKTMLDLGPSALFKVQKFQVKNGGDRQVDLEMSYGTMRASVSKPIASNGKFQIRTKTATMGVRGTEFIVQAPQGALSSKGPQEKAANTTVTVVQGKVAVATPSLPSIAGDSRAPAASAAPVMLTAGTQITSNSSGAAAQPVKLTAVEMTAVTTSAQVKDNTFTQAITMDTSAGGSGGSETRNALTVALNDPLLGGGLQNLPPALPPVPQRPSGFPSAPVPIGGLKHIHIVVSQ